MKRKLFYFGLGLGGLTLIPSYYYLDDLKDTLYIPGGLRRGLRCLTSGTKVVFKYLSVYKFITLERC